MQACQGNYVKAISRPFVKKVVALPKLDHARYRDFSAVKIVKYRIFYTYHYYYYYHLKFLLKLLIEGTRENCLKSTENLCFGTKKKENVYPCESLV